MNKAKKMTSILAASFMFATAFATFSVVKSNHSVVSSLDGLKLVAEEKATLANLANKKYADTTTHTTLDKESAAYSVRLGENAGLRFKYSLTSTMLASAFDDNAVDFNDYTFGVYVTKTASLNGATLTSKIDDTTVTKLKVDATKTAISEDNSEVTFAAVLVGFDAENEYNTDFTSVAYVSNGTTTLYTAESYYSYMKAINYYLDDTNDVHAKLSEEQLSELTTLKEDKNVSYRIVEDGDNLKLYQYATKTDTNIGDAIATTSKPATSTAEYTINTKDKGSSSISGTLYEFTQSGNVYTSSTKGIGSSLAAMTITATTDGNIVFDYNVQGESGYDYFSAEYVKSGETTISNISDTNGTSLSKISNGDTPVTGRASVTVSKGDVIILTYRKDGSGNRGTDCAIITIAGSSSTTNIATFETFGGSYCNPDVILNGALFGGLPTPTKDGYYFDGWYSTNTFDAASKVDSNTTLNADTTLYASWLDLRDACPLMGSHTGLTTSGTSLKNSFTTLSGKGITFGYHGDFVAQTSSNSSFSGTYDAATNTFDVSGASMFYDAEAGLIVMAHSATPTTSTYYTTYVVGSGTTSMYSSGSYTYSFDSGKYRYLSIQGKELFIDVAKNQVYFNVKAYDENGNVVSPSAIADQFVIYVKQGDTLLNTFGYAGSSTISSTTDSIGVYTADNGTDTVKLSGAGYLIYSAYSTSSKIKYTKVSDTVFTIENYYSYSYTFTFDHDAKTVSVTENKHEISYEWNDHTDESAEKSNPTEKWNNCWLYTSDVKPSSGTVITEGDKYYVFKGWYTDDTLTTAYKQTKVTTNITLYASWAEAFKVTYDANGGTCDDEFVYVEGNTTISSLPSPTKSGYVFAGWTLNDVAFDSTTSVTGNITLKASWEEAPFFTGTYYGVNIDNSGAGKASTKTPSSGSSYQIKLTEDGNAYVKSSSKTSTWVKTNYDETTHILTLADGKKIFIYKMSNGDVLAVTDYSISTSTICDDDFMMYVKPASSSTTYSDCKFDYVYWENGYMGIAKVTAGTNVSYVYIDGVDSHNKVYADVTLTDFDGNAVAFDSLYDTTSKTFVSKVLIKDSSGTEIARFGGTSTGFIVDDGLSGTYTGSLNGKASTVFLDGYGAATLDSVAGTYTYDTTSKVVTLVVNKDTYQFTITTVDTLTQKLDGSEGTYTGTLGDLVLTGYGVATLGESNATYVPSGTLIALTIGEEISYVTIDKTAKTYVVTTLSKFSSCVFTGSGNCNDYQSTMKIQFNEGTTISGLMAFTGTLKETDYNTCVFTGVYDDEAHTLTLTVTSATAGSDLTGKVYVFSVEDGKLTFVSTTASRNIFKVDSNYTLTCADFKA